MYRKERRYFVIYNDNYDEMIAFDYSIMYLGIRVFLLLLLKYGDSLSLSFSLCSIYKTLSKLAAL
jgi:hypothetical protein